jgi:hypothetical protein
MDKQSPRRRKPLMDVISTTRIRIWIFASSLIMMGGLRVVDAVFPWDFRALIALFLVVFGVFVFLLGDALRIFRQWVFVIILAYSGCAIAVGVWSGLRGSGRGWLSAMVATAFFLYCFRFKDAFDQSPSHLWESLRPRGQHVCPISEELVSRLSQTGGGV